MTWSVSSPSGTTRTTRTSVHEERYLMRARNKIITAVGAAAGVIIALTTAVAPASASRLVVDPTTTVTPSMTCASFDGLTVTAPSASFSNVGLQAGQGISVRVSPAVTGDTILLTASVGLSLWVYSSPATQTFTFTAPSSTIYNPSWSYVLSNNSTSTDTRTWTFDCTSTSSTVAPPTTIADDDHDGVANTSDVCPGTVLPDSYAKKAAGSYFANASKVFVDGTGRAANITVADTGGCSATQIAKSLGLSKKASQSGISLTILTNWANTH
jgi:hypothetical protein